MYLVQVGAAIFAPDQVVRVWYDADDSGPVVNILLSCGEPLAFRGAEAEAWLAFSAPAIHRLDHPLPPIEQGAGVVILPASRERMS